MTGEKGVKKKQKKNKKMRTKFFFTISLTLLFFAVIVSVLFIVFLRHFSVEQTYKKLMDSQWDSIVHYSPVMENNFIYYETSEDLFLVSNQYSIPEIMVVSEEPLDFPIGLTQIVNSSLVDVMYAGGDSVNNGYSLTDVADNYFTENASTTFDVFMKDIFFVKDTFSTNIVNTIGVIEHELSIMEGLSKRYTLEFSDRILYFQITKTMYNDRWFYVISYLEDDYSESLIKSISVIIFPILSLAIVFGLVLAALIANNITKPLSKLERKVQEISENKWDEPVSVKSNDEIGRLADSVEEMRKNLVKRDENQQAFLQYVSHELKTPIATAKSYTEAIRDEIYPKGTLEDSLEVIDEQFGKIEKRVNDLLNLTRTEYISEKKNHFKHDGFTDFIRIFMAKTEKKHPEFNWQVHVDEVTTPFAYEEDMFEVMMENIISNQIRYAREHIIFRLEAYPGSFRIIFENDGPQIDETELQTIFEPFHKGSKGINGLGLNIVKRIVAAHDGEIEVENIGNGVRFTITF